MPDYQAMYTILFNAITDAVDAMDDDISDTARSILIRAQQLTEELYIESGE